MEQKDYISQKRKIKAIGIPLTVALSLIPIKGCADAMTDNYDNPLRNSPVVSKTIDARDVSRKLESLSADLRSYIDSEDGALQSLKRYNQNYGLLGENDKPLSGIERFVSQIDAVNRDLENDVETLSKTKEYGDFISHASADFLRSMLMVLGGCILVYVSAKATSDKLREVDTQRMADSGMGFWPYL